MPFLLITACLAVGGRGTARIPAGAGPLFRGAFSLHGAEPPLSGGKRSAKGIHSTQVRCQSACGRARPRPRMAGKPAGVGESGPGAEAGRVIPIRPGKGGRGEAVGMDVLAGPCAIVGRHGRHPDRGWRQRDGLTSRRMVARPSRCGPARTSISRPTRVSNRSKPPPRRASFRPT